MYSVLPRVKCRSPGITIANICLDLFKYFSFQAGMKPGRIDFFMYIYMQDFSSEANAGRVHAL